MEFLRFGSSIPGGYWGCCACCIIQNFKIDPKAKASIQLVSGDGGGDLGGKFMGPTYEDIFRERVRTGTFSATDMPNHMFLAILTKSQVSGGVGHAWLKILKEEGFEFLRTSDNSVYTGANVPAGDGSGSAHENYLFGLFRNISGSRVKDPFTPPKEWTDLPAVVDEAWAHLSLTDRNDLAKNQTATHKAHWFKHGPTKFISEQALVKAGAPVTMAGLRLPGAAPALKAQRDSFLASNQKGSAFPIKVVHPA